MTVELPACREAAAPETPPPVVEFPPSRERILVMDDEAALRKLLKTVLGNLGYEVHTARDGAEAIALYEKARSAGWSYDAVLLDLTVSGGMGGVEAAARLKEIERNCRLIVSSGYADASVMSEFAVYGFDAVLPKPWTVAELGHVLQRVLAAQAERKLD
jgi:CheY-like chemotaxis protein